MKDTDDDLGVRSQAAGPGATPRRFAGYNAGPPAHRAGSASSAGPPADGDRVVLMAGTSEEADKLADDLPTVGKLEDQEWHLARQVMAKWHSRGSRSPDHQATRQPGAQAPGDEIQKQLLTNIHAAADGACTRWLQTLPPAGPPAIPQETSPAVTPAAPNALMTMYFDIIEGDAPLFISSSSSPPSTRSVRRPSTPGPFFPQVARHEYIAGGFVE